MKNLPRYLIIAGLTFGLGLGLTLVWLSHDSVDVPSPLEGVTLNVDYYELEMKPAAYTGDMIRLEVTTGVDCSGSLLKGQYDEPLRWGQRTFFGVDFAQDSRQSLEKAQVSVGADPEDPKCKFSLVRMARMTVVGKLIEDGNKVDFLGRRYPFWLIIHRVERLRVVR
jgi:hypothetical protein